MIHAQPTTNGLQNLCCLKLQLTQLCVDLESLCSFNACIHIAVAFWPLLVLLDHLAVDISFPVQYESCWIYTVGVISTPYRIYRHEI